MLRESVLESGSLERFCADWAASFPRGMQLVIVASASAADPFATDRGFDRRAYDHLVIAALQVPLIELLEVRALNPETSTYLCKSRQWALETGTGW